MSERTNALNTAYVSENQMKELSQYIVKMLYDKLHYLPVKST